MADLIRGSVLTLGDRAKVTAKRAVSRILSRRTQEIVNNARARWPVKTGRSRAALIRRITGRGYVIADPVGYAKAIVSNGVRPWDAFVVQPVRQLVTVDGPREIGAALVEGLKVKRG